MLSLATAPTRSGQSNRQRLLAAIGLALATATASLALPALDAGASATAAAKTTTFTGRIVSATGGYATLRGSVRLVLRSSAGPPTTGPNPSPFSFSLALSAPNCAPRKPSAPRRCVALAGTVTGSAVAAPYHADVGRIYSLSAHGRVAPLGRVTASGTTSGTGFIARGRFPLSLRLRTGAGSVTISAQGPVVPGFSSPF